MSGIIAQSKVSSTLNQQAQFEAAQKDQTIEQLQREIAGLRSKAKDYDTLKQQMTNMDSAYRRDLSQGSSKEVGYHQRIDEVYANEFTLKIKRDKMDQDITRMGRQIVHANGELRKVQALALERTNAMEKMVNDFEKTEDVIIEEAKLYEKLSSQLKNIRNHKNQVGAENSTLTQQSLHLSNQLNQLINQKLDYEKQIQDKFKIKANMDEQMKIINDQFNARKVEVDVLNEEMRRNNEQVDSLRSQALNYERSHQQTEYEIKQNEAQLTTYMETGDDQKRQVASLEHQIEILRTRTKQLKDQQDQMKHKRRHIKEHIDNLKVQLREKEQYAHSLSMKNRSMVDTLERSVRTNEEIRQRLPDKQKIWQLKENFNEDLLRSSMEVKRFANQSNIPHTYNDLQQSSLRKQPQI